MRVIKFEDNNALSFVADNQVWTDEDVKILREEYNIFFNKEGVFAIRVIPRKSPYDPLIQICIEDDGIIYVPVETNEKLTFSSSFIPDLIDLLTEVNESDCINNTQSRKVNRAVKAIHEKITGATTGNTVNTPIVASGEKFKNSFRKYKEKLDKQIKDDIQKE